MPAVTGNHYIMAFILMLQAFQSAFGWQRLSPCGKTELQGRVLSFPFPDAQ